MGIENNNMKDSMGRLGIIPDTNVPAEVQDQEESRLQKRLLDLNKDAAHWFQGQLSLPSGEKARSFLAERQISWKTADSFGLGYAPDDYACLLNAMQEKGYSVQELIRAGLVTEGNTNKNVCDRFRDRLIFPIQDIRGEVLGFSGRLLADRPEAVFLNGPDTAVFSKRSTLYGIYQAQNPQMGSIRLVEGFLNVITLHDSGFANAVACIGTALTEEQAMIIARCAKKVMLCYDSDNAGRKAAKRALVLLKNCGLDVTL